MVPRNAAAVWNVAPTQIYSTQNGRITFAASSASPWPANNGVLAELTFEVQAAAGSQYAWPLTLSAVEITPDGFRTEILPSSGNLFIGRDPVRPLLSLPTWTVSGEIEFTISGDSGARYAIEASSDLTTWRAIAEGVAAGVVHVLDENGSPFAHRFYRARLVE
jgi:hypothetical protein